MKKTFINHPLIKALFVLPANIIYTMTSRRILKEGYLMHKSRSVSDIKWNSDRSSLIIFIKNSRNHVIVSLVKSKPDFDCNCGSSRGGDCCKHVICAMITVIHLLRPTLFTIPIDNGRYRETLLSGITRIPKPLDKPETATEEKALPNNGEVSPQQKKTASPSKARYEIVIDEDRRRFSFYVTRNSMRIDFNAIDRRIPDRLLRISLSTPWSDRQNQLLLYLSRHGNKDPILFKDGDTKIRVLWKEREKYETWTKVDTRGEKIIVEKRCSSENGRQTRVLGNFVFDMEREHFFYAEDTKGWDLWDRLINSFSPNTSVSYKSEEKKDLSRFVLLSEGLKRLHFTISSEEKEKFFESVSFNIEGQESTVHTLGATSYALSARSDKNNSGSMILAPICMVEKYSFSSLQGIDILSDALGSSATSAAIRSKKRKNLLFSTLFEAASQKSHTAGDNVVKKRLDDNAIAKPQLRRLARRVVRKQISYYKRDEFQLHLCNGKWGLVSVDKEKMLTIHTILFEIFGYEVFERTTPTKSGLILHQNDFHKGLYRLYERLDEKGIKLLFEDKPLLSATWEFELDTVKTSIDWFEIKPEIRHNGKIIDRKTWETALANKGIVVVDDKVQVLDAQSLKTLTALFEKTEASRSSPKEVIAVQRLKILDLLRLRREKVTIKLPPEDEEIMARLLRFEKIEERPLPQGMTCKLRQYQKEGYYWLSFLYENRFGACLADDMGLGKTVQAIALLAGIKEGKITRRGETKPIFLIVVPPSLLFNWEREIFRFYPDFTVYSYKGKERSNEFDGHDVILTSYGLVRRDIHKLKKIPFDVIIFDEAQTVKNIFADTTGAVRLLTGGFKLTLTGTPVENHIGEYFSILDLSLPGLLGGHKDFMRQAKHDMLSLLPTVVARTKPFVLRRTKEQILKELPPKIEYDVYLELTEKQKALYNTMVNEVKSAIEDAYESKTVSQAKIIALTAILKLRQICLSPCLLTHNLDESAPKIVFLKDKLEELRAESHGALIFSQFTSFLDIVEKEISGNGFRVFRLDGSTPVSKRKEIVEGFQGCSDPAVFLLSLKAGGQGLNLTRASYVFHLDPWWNPAVENQASDRTHRIGQKKKVIVTRILMRHSIEEKMLELKKRKSGLYNAIMEAPEKSSRLSITREDFEFLLSGP